MAYHHVQATANTLLCLDPFLHRFRRSSSYRVWWALLPGKILKDEKWGKTTTASMATDFKVSAKAHYLLPPVHSGVILLDLVSCLVGWPGLILPGHSLCSPCCSLTVLSCSFIIIVSQHRIKRHLSESPGCQLHSSHSQVYHTALHPSDGQGQFPCQDGDFIFPLLVPGHRRCKCSGHCHNF